MCKSKTTGKKIQEDITKIQENVNLYTEMSHHVPVNTELKGLILWHSSQIK